jgi:transmembrane sensor
MHLERLFNWFKRKHVSNSSDATTRSIDDAIAASARNLRAVESETGEQWRRMESGLVSGKQAGIAPKKVVSTIALRPVVTFAVAAIALIVIGVVWLFRPSIRIYETTKGQHAAIALPDSTEVTLNYMSELTVSHSVLETTRKVALKGEAFFDVRHTGMPFIVSTDIGTIRVLGTQFNVRMRDDQLDVGVVRGSVEVAVNRNGADTSLILSKGQIVTCTTTGFQENPATLPFSNYPGWIHGRLMFYHTDLISACRELESQFDIHITVQHPQLRTVTITGTIDGHDVDTALATLARLTGSNYRREDSGYVLY